ncbi:hypothetical protein [Mangrovihabitans endophyticus]|uniref:Uncharacterized protein n=1 Tax=Mangrovihabitans endophyticus TaxID=1751298 RepID=A0A8J3C4S3_9ACTN|nr:hypothetical protein [Mangrovihabitans endophyticus]GGL07326.1 hypothetical protein GCM10012284_47010 [Mangrovihabitans endophyticus]
MLVLVLVAAVAVVLIVVIVWPAVRGHGDDAAPTPAIGPESAAEHIPESLEGALVGQLLRCEISRAQFRAEMARAAQRDADRHPLVMPPDIAPPEA